MADNASIVRPFRERFVERLKFGLLMLEGLSQLHRFTGLRIYPYAVFVGDVDSQEATDAKITGVEYRALDGKDVPAIVLFPRPGDPSTKARRYAARLEHSLGYGAFIGGQLVGYCWADRREVRIPVANAGLLELGPGEASVYDFYVLPQFRGNRIGPALRQAMYEELAREGRRRTYRVASIFNASSLRVVARSRARKLETRILLGFPELLAWDFRLRAGASNLQTKRLIVVTRAHVQARRRQAAVS